MGLSESAKSSHWFYLFGVITTMSDINQEMCVFLMVLSTDKGLCAAIKVEKTN